MMNTLTERQREIKEGLDAGLTVREIAEQLGITRNAVYQQMQRLRHIGALAADFNPSGQPVRETPRHQPGIDTLRELLPQAHAGERTATLALAAELARTRNELRTITERLSSLLE